VPDLLVFPLHNGLQLTLTGQPTLRAVRNFLRAATVHFKNQRDIQGVEIYTAGSFQGRNCAVSNPGESHGRHLPPAAWVDALLDADAKVKTLEETSPTDPLAALGQVFQAPAQPGA
jgi:hypothetical protein